MQTSLKGHRDTFNAVCYKEESFSPPGNLPKKPTDKQMTLE